MNERDLKKLQGLDDQGMEAMFENETNSTPSDRAINDGRYRDLSEVTLAGLNRRGLVPGVVSTRPPEEPMVPRRPTLAEEIAAEVKRWAPPTPKTGVQEPLMQPSSGMFPPVTESTDPLMRDSLRPHKVHRLKSHREVFEQLRLGKLTEIRKADRDYQDGDYLLLSEFDRERRVYTGQWTARRITHITPPGEWGLPEDTCALSIAPVSVADGMVEYFLDHHEPEETFVANMKARRQPPRTGHDAFRSIADELDRSRDEMERIVHQANSAKPVDTFRGLTQHQVELLYHLMQECGEVTKAVTKLLCFGTQAIDHQTGVRYDNSEKLGVECGNLQHMIQVCFGADIITDPALKKGMQDKQEGLQRYLRCR